MKYAVAYTSDFRNYDEVDEIIFTWANHIEDLINKVVRPNQRVHIQIENKDLNMAIPIFNKLKEKYPNLLVNLKTIDKGDIQLLKDNELKYMFQIFAGIPSIAKELYDLGAEDIYIVEDLCFQLEKLQVFRDNRKQLRIFPNIVQTPHFTDDLPQITSFWVRPEDTEIYEHYIDTFEIFPTPAIGTIFKIYRQRQWLGKISDIVQGYKDEEISNTNIAPHFGQFRLNCNRRCSYNQCNICLEIESLAAKMKEGNLEIIKKRFVPAPPLTDEEKISIINKLIEDGKELNEKYSKTTSE